MALACCCDCGRGFHRGEDEPWKTRCLDCFKKMKRATEYEPRLSEGQRWSERYFEADCECLRLKSQVDELRAQLAARPAFDSALLDELRDMLPRLRQLCHPDRHSGSVAATKASQWLNDLRTRLH